MQIILVKHIQLFCMTWLFTSVNCDQMLYNNTIEHGHIYEIAACTVRCLTANNTIALTTCYENCTQQNLRGNKIKYTNDESAKLELLCRNDTSFLLNIKHNFSDAKEENDVESSHISDGSLYIIKLHRANDLHSGESIFLINSSTVILENLSPETLYNISAAIVHGNNEVIEIVGSLQITTLKKFFNPGDITDITLLKYVRNEFEKGVIDVEILWKPAKDMTCQYDVVLLSLGDDLHVHGEDTMIIRNRYAFTFRNLSFDMEYKYGVRGANSHLSHSRDFIWHFFKTPSCLEIYKNDTSYCPIEPELNTIDVIHVVDNQFSFNITWSRAAILPDFFTLQILDVDPPINGNSLLLNISKEKTSIFVDNMILNGMKYEVILTAYTSGGHEFDIEVGSVKTILELSHRKHIQKLLIAIIVPIICLTLTSLFILGICHRRARIKRYQQRCKYFEELEKKAPVDPNSNFEFITKNLPILPSIHQLSTLQLDLETKLYINDEMEVDRKDVQLFETLGEGAFGLVRRGILNLENGNESEVAVKMVKDQPSVDDIKEFRREIEVMKSVGAHPNIVGLIGHCTKDLSQMWLLTEYCCYGNLLDFLRSEWDTLVKIKSVNNCTNSECLTPVLTLQKKPESVFNFDNSIIDKISVKYKNIDVHKNSSANDTSHDDVIPRNLVINKLYEYNQMCTNSCRCKVDIVNDECLGNNDGVNTQESKIRVLNCECRTTRPASDEEQPSSPLLVENKGYYKLLCNNNQNNRPATFKSSVTCDDLLDFSKQIAKGMEFLAKNKVVHRDLAARNVLVCENKIVKIADFGLSRDVYQENMYKKTGNGKLPFKWLAIESLTHQIYTSQSDVWSYGILLYEIVTLGASPYPSIPTNRLLKLLKTGYRMEKPINCSREFYDLMRSCWHELPSDRPNFTEICSTLDNMLLDFTKGELITLGFIECDKRSKSTSDDSYLKPL